MSDQAVNTLNKLKSFVQTDQERMQNIAVSITEIQSFSAKVGEAMEKVADISSKSAVSVSEASASTHEIYVQIETVNDLANHLEKMARSELDLMAKFITRDDE